ncbi:MAG: WD40 repeat domain-containing protein, partial [Promethearchaeia archaeon]
SPSAKEAPKYFQMAGVLPEGSFRHAVHLHPHERLAATSAGLGAISIWSQRLPGMASYATGEQTWDLVAKVAPTRTAGTDIVLALAFIPAPSLPAADVFLASASSDGTIKIWAGPAQAPSILSATPPDTTASAASCAKPDAHMGRNKKGQGASNRADADLGEEQPEKVAHVRLTLEPFTSDLGGEVANSDEIAQVISHDVAAALNVHHSRVRTDVRSSDSKQCIADISVRENRLDAEEEEKLEAKIFQGPASRIASTSVEELAANVQARKKSGGEVSAYEIQADENTSLQTTLRLGAAAHAAAAVDNRGRTELLAALLSQANDENSTLHATRKMQRIRRAKIVFVAPAVARTVSTMCAPADTSEALEAAADAGRRDRAGAAGVAERFGVRRIGESEVEDGGGLRWRLLGTLVDGASASCSAKGVSHTDQVFLTHSRALDPAGLSKSARPHYSGVSADDSRSLQTSPVVCALRVV